MKETTQPAINSNYTKFITRNNITYNNNDDNNEIGRKNTA